MELCVSAHAATQLSPGYLGAGARVSCVSCTRCWIFITATQATVLWKSVARGPEGNRRSIYKVEQRCLEASTFKGVHTQPSVLSGPQEGAFIFKGTGMCTFLSCSVITIFWNGTPQCSCTRPPSCPFVSPSRLWPFIVHSWSFLGPGLLTCHRSLILSTHCTLHTETAVFLLYLFPWLNFHCWKFFITLQKLDTLHL